MGGRGSQAGEPRLRNRLFSCRHVTCAVVLLSRKHPLSSLLPSSSASLSCLDDSIGFSPTLSHHSAAQDVRASLLLSQPLARSLTHALQSLSHSISDESPRLEDADLRKRVRERGVRYTRGSAMSHQLSLASLSASGCRPPLPLLQSSSSSLAASVSSIHRQQDARSCVRSQGQQ